MRVAGAAWLALFALVFGSTLPAAAQCANTSRTCIEAKRSHQRVCARVGSSDPRRDCYAIGEKAYVKCLATGQWIIDQCNLSGLDKK
jgi:hypothetical protein